MLFGLCEMLKIWESSYDEHMLILLTVSRYSTKDYHYNSWNGKCEKHVETENVMECKRQSTPFPDDLALSLSFQ